MALFSRRKETTEEVAPSPEQVGKPAASDVVAEIRPGRRRTVGQLLRETRESFGSDIPRVAAALRIRAPFLEAIEEGHYDRLPGPVYALGFVRAYAVHLGLDGEEAVRRFKLEAEGFEAQRDLSFPVPLAERSIPGGAMVLAALMLAVCAYGIWYYLSSSARPRPEQVSPVPAELAKDLAPAPRRAAAPTPAPADSAPPAPPAAPSTPPAVDNSAPAPAAAAPSPSTAEGTVPQPAITAAAPPAVPAASGSPVTPPAPAPSPIAGAPVVSPAPVAAPTPVAAAPAPAPADEPSPAASASATEMAPPPPPVPVQTAALPATAGATPVPDQPHVYGLANGDTRIVIHAVSDSWIQVRDKDHKPIFTRQLHTGDSYHVPDDEGLVMKTGKGAGLAITVDGKPTPPLGGAVRNNVLLDPDRLLAGTALRE